MRRYVLSLLLALLLCLLGGDFAGWAAATDALTPVGSTTMPLMIDDDTVAVWSGGTLVSVQNRYSSAPILRMIDRDGTQISQFTFRIPGASLINIYDNSVARGLDGSLAIVGTAYSDDSRGGMFVAWVAPDGREQTIIRTSPFFPGAVTVASDGTIWVAGHQTKERNKERDYSQRLIRRYDKTGKLLGSFIPWSTVKSDPPTLPVVSSALLSLKDRVVWYSPQSHIYVEFSLDGSVIKYFKSAPHPDHDLTWVAACADGSLFASTLISNAGQQAHWGIFALDRQRGEWSLIPRNEKWGNLLGCDGTHLATTTDLKTISWLELVVK